MPKTSIVLATVAVSLAAVALSGCRVSSSKDKNGKDNNVEINSPFGNMQVKTNEAADVSAIGITAYPGAVPWKDDNSDHDSADVNMSFGDFHLGVKAATFRSQDPQDKIIAFYKKDLARYGEVLSCRGDVTLGEPTRTAQGLTCADKDSKNGKINVQTSDDKGSLELRTGSPTHQHIVGIDDKDGSVKIALVNLELPSHLGKHGPGSIE